ncbi:STAS/SEC14 domain-containing protein [Olivibacter sp. SDN3]|uniref:STAS/SEC14 domain-containing protein n=1 Tax=Olivibacter sp. SDN3 TaxID=2764720 RepID=UPI001650FFB7|nr:STAS/SEC14 domain-containing protein [Olivibacter sp. SDN3]QNL48222.1 STAS/SEC14 domain-containing protein [Olivibacter sp. SDN3]
MLENIQDLPAHVFGVKATKEVTGEDLKNVLIPGLEELTYRYGEIYYLLVLYTPVKNFTATAWFQDMLAGIKHFSQWKKMAIVTDEKGVRRFTDAFSKVAPGEAKGFSHSEVTNAITWLSEKSEQTKNKKKFPLKTVILAAFGILLATSLFKKNKS